MRMNLDTAHAVLPAVADEAITVCQLGPALSSNIKDLIPHDGYFLTGIDPITQIRCPFTTDSGYQAASYPLLARAERTGRSTTKLMTGDGFGSELRIALSQSTVPFGELTLLRETGRTPFSATDAARAEHLSPALGAAMRRFVGGKRLRPPKDMPTAPGVIIVGQDDRILSTTPEARLWLRRLVDNPDTASDDELFRFIWNTAYAARRKHQADPAEDGLALGRIPAFGGWIGMHARPLDGEQSGQIAVVLDAPPGHVLLPALAVWYGLTPAERTIAENLRLGLTTKSIARRLECSPHTVNDHLKALFRKTGIAGREELLAALAP
jgi:DNA-binding CsgD family transcriptional regulator